MLIEVNAALTEGDYKFRITKNGRGINRLLIQDEKLVAEYVYDGNDGQVQVDKILEPYDLTSSEYKMSLEKTDLPGDEYINQISFFRLHTRNVRKNLALI